METNRRNFLISAGLAGAGFATFPSLVSSEEKDFNPKVKGWAIQDPLDKQKIRGFVYIPSIWGEQLRIPDKSHRSAEDSFDDVKRAPIGLVEAINKYTNINAFSEPVLYISSHKLIEYPFIYIATEKQFELTNTEKENFNNYLRNGGFAVLESLNPELDYSQAEASLKQMIKDTLKKDARFSPIPISHPLYHCFFDFNDGPPQGTENNWMTTIMNVYTGMLGIK